MVNLTYTDSDTLDLSGDGSAGAPLTAEIKPLGAACSLVDDPEARAKLETVTEDAINDLQNRVTALETCLNDLIAGGSPAALPNHGAV